MSRIRIGAFAVAALICAAGVDASAQPVRLSLADVLARARSASPSVLLARARVEESRGRLAGARVRFENNPYIDLTSGHRRTFDGRDTTDIEVGLLQTFETGGQRAARIAGAEADIASSAAAADDASRRALEVVASAYLRHQLNVERRALRAQVESNAVELQRVAQRRYDAGDIAALDLNLARTTVVRAQVSVVAAGADTVASAGVLARLLGLSTTAIEPTEPLARDWPADLQQLRAAVESRPDLVALKASVAEAEADIRLGQANGRPDIGVGVRGKREGGDHALVGVVTFTFPTFNGGQQLIATGAARAARLRQELDATRATALAEIDSLQQEYEQRRLAAQRLAEALPVTLENVQLSQRSFEEGELSLADVMVVRNDVLAIQLDYLDRVRDAADIAVARDAAAGVLK